MQSNLPIYVQLSNILKTGIADGTYKQGSFLPSERKIALTYGINRLTVRAALKLLTKDGFITAMHGKGYLINKKVTPKTPIVMQLHFSNLMGLSTRFTKLGLHQTDEVLINKYVSAGYVQSKHFKIKKDDKLFRLVRKRYVNNQLITIEDTKIQSKLIPNIEQIDFSTKSLYGEFDRCNVSLNRIYQEIFIYTLNGEKAKLFNVKDGTHCFCQKQWVYTINEELAEMAITYIHPHYATVSSMLSGYSD